MPDLKLLTVQEAATIARTPLATVRFWLSQRRIPSCGVGVRRLIREADLLAFLGLSADGGRTLTGREHEASKTKLAEKALATVGKEPARRAPPTFKNPALQRQDHQAHVTAGRKTDRGRCAICRREAKAAAVPVEASPNP